jgi:hypothetical protein
MLPLKQEDIIVCFRILELRLKYLLVYKDKIIPLPFIYLFLLKEGLAI